MSDEDIQDRWFKVLNLARESSAIDMDVSNNLLATIDQIWKATRADQNIASEVDKLLYPIINQSVRLTQKSKTMSEAVAKLVGVV